MSFEGPDRFHPLSAQQRPQSSIVQGLTLTTAAFISSIGIADHDQISRVPVEAKRPVAVAPNTGIPIQEAALTSVKSKDGPIDFSTFQNGEVPFSTPLLINVKLRNGEEQEVIMEYSEAGVTINGQKFEMKVTPTNIVLKRFPPKTSALRKVVKLDDTRVVEGKGFADRIGHSFMEVSEEFPLMMEKFNNGDEVIHKYDVYGGPYTPGVDRDELSIVGTGKVVRIKNDEQTANAEVK